MPNHVTQTIRIKGDIDKLIECGFIVMGDDTGDGQLVDFNGITPMPKELLIESGTRMDRAITVLQNGSPLEISRLETDDPESFAIGKQAMENLSIHGHTDWYGWAIENWGTKWNAYDESNFERVSDNAIVVTFDTAWSPADPIFSKLGEMGYGVDGFYFDEYGGSEVPLEIGEGHDHFSVQMSAEYNPFLDTMLEKDK